ncbi:GTP-binding protein, partial [Fulvivirga sp. RKSG066]|nr:GTP-binding protein [Fulvivirga aurantia]
MSPTSYQLLHPAIYFYGLSGNPASQFFPSFFKRITKVELLFLKIKYLCKIILKKMTDTSNHKAGFVSIIGKPNVGKSTLMNQMVGEKLSIITSKAQTTRHRIMGIISGKDFQIVYSDTPGIIKPQYQLQESMMHFVNYSLEDADVV